MQPAPPDGSLPLGSNKWYMMEYELAYDSKISGIPYSSIQLSWFLNYYNVTKIDLGGNIVGKLTGVIGAAETNASKDIFSSLGNLGKTAGTGVVAGVGVAMVSNSTINAETGENKMGLDKQVFKALSKGLSGALSGASGGLPGAAIGFLSAIAGGSSSATPISFDLRADIKLEGTGTDAGSFPSSPISFWMPGTNIASNAVGYIPLYNKTLGVVNFSGKPEIKTSVRVTTQIGEDPNNGYEYERDFYRLSFPSKVDYSKNLIINPEVLKIADVTIKNQEHVIVLKGNQWVQSSWHRNGEVFVKPANFWWVEGYYETGENAANEPIYDIGVRFTIEVKPKNGTPASTIIKSFLLQEKREYTFN